MEEDKPLRRFVANHLRWTYLWELSKERLCMLHPGRVIQCENTKDITCFKGGTWLFDKLHNAIFLCDQRHIHLHDFNFSKRLAGLYVLSIFHSELHKFSWTRGSELGRVVLRFE